MALLPLPSDQTAFVSTPDGKPIPVFYKWLRSIFELCGKLAGLSDNAGGGAVGGAWTSYTPTVAASVGTIGSYTATGRYTQLGKTVCVQFSVSIVSAGTASSYLRVTLPVPAVDTVDYSLSGIETSGPYSVVAWISATDPPNLVFLKYYDGSNLIVTGRYVFVTGVYEAA